MTPEIEAIVAADRAARREIDAVAAQLAARVRAERERLQEARLAQLSAVQACIEQDASALEREARLRVEARRLARAAAREARRERAASAREAAIAAYVAILGAVPR